MFYTCNSIFSLNILNILLRVYNKRIDDVFSFFSINLI